MSITFYGKLEPFSQTNSIKLGMSLDKLNHKLSKECKEFVDIINRIPEIIDGKSEWEGDNLVWRFAVGNIALKATSIADLEYKFEITKN
jgi:hypothetical protein